MTDTRKLAAEEAKPPKSERLPGSYKHDESYCTLSTKEFALSDPCSQCLVRWNHSTFYNMTILGLCNLAAPGIWGAMNSLGAGGAATPQLVNAANALTFCLMVVSCYFSTVLVRYIGIKWALVFGT
jgi:hypothetical protein